MFGSTMHSVPPTGLMLLPLWSQNISPTINYSVMWWKVNWRRSTVWWKIRNVLLPLSWGDLKFLLKSTSSWTWWIRWTTWSWVEGWPTRLLWGDMSEVLFVKPISSIWRSISCVLPKKKGLIWYCPIRLSSPMVSAMMRIPNWLIPWIFRMAGKDWISVRRLANVLLK